MDFGAVGAGDAGAGSEADRSGGSGGDQSGFAASKMSEAFSNFVLELREEDIVARSFGHGTVEVLPHFRGAKDRLRAVEIDDRADAELSVNTADRFTGGARFGKRH